MHQATEYVHEAGYVAMVQVNLTDDGTPWSPYLATEDGDKLDQVRLALRAADLKRAAALAKVYRLTPIAV